VAGELNVPVIMVAGEARLIDDDIKENAPWVETVRLKHSLSRVSAQSPSLTRIEKELQEATKRAAGKHRKGGFELLRTAKPTKVKIVFQRSHFADVAEMLPEVRRLSGLEVECSAKDIIDALKIFELLMFACSGMTSLLERMG
jgi:D-amino peptidase